MFMNFDQHVLLVFDDLSESEKETVGYIRKNKEEVSKMSITDLSSKVLSSKSTILRLAKKLGFRGYSELKYSLVEDSNQISIIPSDLIGLLKHDIEQTFQYSQQINFEPLIEKIRNAGHVYIYPSGYTQNNYAQELSKELLLTGRDNYILSGKSNFEMVTPRLTSEDFVIIISLSGEMDGLQETIKKLILENVPICSITDFGKNFLSKHSNYQLFYQTSSLPNFQTKGERSMVGLSIILAILSRKYREAILFDE